MKSSEKWGSLIMYVYVPFNHSAFIGKQRDIFTGPF